MRAKILRTFFIFAFIVLAGSAVFPLFSFSALAADQAEEELCSGVPCADVDECIPVDNSGTTYSSPYDCEVSEVYRCTNDFCGNQEGSVSRGEKYYTCIDQTDWWDDGCGGSAESTTTLKSGPEYRDKGPIPNSVGLYQVCSGSAVDWTDSFPLVECSGSCYPAPVPTPLSDENLSPQNIPDGSSWKLPVNIGWSDVEEITNTEEGGFCSVGSYRYQITEGSSTALNKVVGAQRQVCGGSTGKLCGGETGVFETARKNNDIRTMNRAHAIADRARAKGGAIAMASCVTLPDGSACDEPLRNALANPTYDYLTGQYTYDFDTDDAFTQDVARGFSEETICALQSSHEYSLRVTACLEGDGEDCSSWSDEENPFSFRTGSAPQLKYPYDPDWEGPNSSNLSNTPVVKIPLEIAWCSSSEAQDYHYVITKNAKEGAENTAWESRDTPTFYKDETGKLLQKGNVYYWKVGACGANTPCSYSQLWSLIPGDFDLSAPLPLSPKNGSTVNKEDEFLWRAGDAFASFFAVRVWQGNTLLAQNFVEHELSGSNLSLKTEMVWDSLTLNTAYEWQVGACADDEASSCESWSDRVSFKTAGAAPVNLQTSPLRGGRTSISARLSWNPREGAASYQYQIFPQGSALPSVASSSQEPAATAGFSDGIRQDTSYVWRARSCAVSEEKLATEAEGACGPWAQSEFLTAKLTAPEITSPGATAFVPSSLLAWDPASVFGAGSYEYAVSYTRASDDETEESCKAAAQGRDTIASETTRQSSTSIPLRCFGDYEAKVRGCSSTEGQCSEPGPWAEHSFSVRPGAGGSGFGGLVPCGRSSNPADTDWDDREPCQIKHVFLGLHTLLSFILWRLVPLLTILLAMGTGAVLYLSLGDANLIAQVKNAWIALGIGFLITIFSWMLLNLTLGLLGFNINAFGIWSQIQF